MKADKKWVIPERVVTNGPRLRRARRMAQGNPVWGAIFDFLSRGEQRVLMVDASENDLQALAGVCLSLAIHFRDELQDRATKIFVGTAVAGLMEEMGYDVVSTGDRMPVSVGGFQTAARFKRRIDWPRSEDADAADAANEDILLTMLSALNERQRQRLSQLLATM